jgi:hypothetical protein
MSFAIRFAMTIAAAGIAFFGIIGIAAPGYLRYFPTVAAAGSEIAAAIQPADLTWG